MSFGEDYVNGYAQGLAEVGEWPKSKRDQNKAVAEGLGHAKAAHKSLNDALRQNRINAEALRASGVNVSELRRRLVRGVLDRYRDDTNSIIVKAMAGLRIDS